MIYLELYEDYQPYKEFLDNIPKSLVLVHDTSLDNKDEFILYDYVNKTVQGYVSLKKSDRAHVLEIAAEKGRGNLLYRIMMMFLWPGYLMSDRKLVSLEAFNVWKKLSNDTKILRKPINKDDKEFSPNWSHDNEHNRILNALYSMKPSILFNKLKDRSEKFYTDNKGEIPAIVAKGREYFTEKYKTKKSLT